MFDTMSIKNLIVLSCGLLVASMVILAFYVFSRGGASATDTPLLVALCVLPALISIVTGIILNAKISGPVQRINAHIQRLGRGDFSRPLTREEFAQDELGDIVNTFTVMQKNLAAAIQEAVGSIDNLDSVTGSLRELSESASLQLATQRSEITQVATAMTELDSSFQEVSQNTASAATASSKVSHEARRGDEIVRAAIQNIEGVNEALTHAAEIINALRQDSDNVSSVSEVIGAIAEQTNLLALNAAIEAARAGEQGRGFAVVADEVRTLAQRTQNSIEEINKTIGSLRDRAGQAVGAMENSQSSMQESVEQARLAGRSIAEITRAVTEISDTTSYIASATEQQTAVTNELTESITSIDSVSDDVSTSAQQTLKACLQLVDANNHLKGAFRNFTL